MAKEHLLPDFRKEIVLVKTPSKSANVVCQYGPLWSGPMSAYQKQNFLAVRPSTNTWRIALNVGRKKGKA